MKKTNLYEIKEKALKSGRAVYSVPQLANLIGKSHTIAKVYAYRCIKRGLARRLVRGKISFIEDDYIIASQLVEPSYISLQSALAFHGLLQQIPANIECVTTKNSLRYKTLGLVYHKLPPALFYGYEKHKKDRSYIFVASAEKAIIDSIYLNVLGKAAVKDLLKRIDKKELIRLANLFKGRGRKKLERFIHAR